MTPRWIPLCFGLLASAVLVSPELKAVLLAYDGFEDYTPEDGFTGMTTTNGGTNWSNNWSGGTADTSPSAVRNVDYSGGDVVVDGGGQSFFRDDVGMPLIQRSWTTAVDLTNAANAVYVSFLWQTRSADGAMYSGGGTDSFFQVTVGSAGAVSNNYGVFTRGNDGHEWNARFSNSTGASDIAITANTTYFVVLKLSSLSASVWINPTSEVEGTPDANKTGTALTGSGFTNVNTLVLRSAVAAANFNIDEIRVGTTFADVVPTAVPEPSAFAILAGGVGLLVAAGRRRKR